MLEHALTKLGHLTFAVIAINLENAPVDQAQEVQNHERERAERIAHNTARTEGGVKCLAPAVLALLLR